MNQNSEWVRHMVRAKFGNRIEREASGRFWMYRAPQPVVDAKFFELMKSAKLNIMDQHFAADEEGPHT
jgi:hypothetical protein